MKQLTWATTLAISLTILTSYCAGMVRIIPQPVVSQPRVPIPKFGTRTPIRWSGQSALRTDRTKIFATNSGELSVSHNKGVHTAIDQVPVATQKQQQT